MAKLATLCDFQLPGDFWCAIERGQIFVKEHELEVSLASHCVQYTVWLPIVLSLASHRAQSGFPLCTVWLPILLSLASHFAQSGFPLCLVHSLASHSAQSGFPLGLVHSLASHCAQPGFPLHPVHSLFSQRWKTTENDVSQCAAWLSTWWVQD